MTVTLTAEHDHRRGYRMRSFVGRPGVWVQRHGDWDRPVHVWLYRGAWRIICWPCMQPVQSGIALWDDGWPSRDAAMTVARAHCLDCPLGGDPS